MTRSEKLKQFQHHLEEILVLAVRYQIRMQALCSRPDHDPYGTQVGEAIDHSIDLIEKTLKPMMLKVETLLIDANEIHGKELPEQWNDLINDYLKVWELGSQLWSESLEKKDILGEGMADLAYNIAQQDVNGVRDHLKIFLHGEA